MSGLSYIDAVNAKNYIDRRTKYATCITCGVLEAAGFHIDRVDGLKIDISRDTLRATVDLTNAMEEIATTPDGGYDQSLSNPVYESCKMRGVLNVRLRVILLSLDSEETLTEKLVELTSSVDNLRISVIRS
jgi:hypothetical protein